MSLVSELRAVIWLRHYRPIVNRFLQFHVRLLLNCLGVLQLLDQLHLKHFHLHDFCLFLPYHFFFLSDLSSNILPRRFLLFTPKFFNLSSLDPFLLLLKASFESVFLVHLILKLVYSLFSLLIYELRLLCFFLFVHQYSVFDLVFLGFSLFFHFCNSLSVFLLFQHLKMCLFGLLLSFLCI